MNEVWGRRAQYTIGAIALIAIVAVMYWPALRAFLEGDDFSLLAFARILRNPLSLYMHEHFPLGPYFRPLTMTLWWLTARAFDTAVMPHYVVNLFLHVGVSLALWRLLVVFTRGSWVSWTVAALFALHPIAIGTSLWLADRFDLLATLFSLLALRAAWDVRLAFSVRRMVLTFLFLAGAVLSKENGIVAVAIVGLIWSWPGGKGSPAPMARSRRGERFGLLVLSILALAWLIWRASVLRAGPNPFPYANVPPVVLLSTGSTRWIADFFQYLLAWGRLPGGGKWLLVCGALSLLAAGVFARCGIKPEAASSDAWLPFGCAAAIVVLSGLIQAPFSYMWSVNFFTASDPTSVAAYARLFYFPLCGIAIGAASGLAPLLCCARAKTLSVRALVGIGVVLIALPWAYAAHNLANGFRRQSNEKRPLIAAAVEAVASADLRLNHCRIFLLDVDGNGTSYVLKTMSDAVIKAMVPAISRVEHCLVQSEQTSWAYTLGGEPLTPDSALPMRPMSDGVEPVPWIRVGGVQVVYLNLYPDIDARNFSDALFLSRADQRFENVTAEVRAGTRPVHFVCTRSPQQCR